MESNLISRFMEIEKSRLNGLNSDVVFITNKSLGTHYQQGRFKEWEHGKRRPSATTHNYILSTVMKNELLEVGLNPVIINRIIKNCSLKEAN